MAKRKIYVGPADNANSTQPLHVEGKVLDAFVPGEILKQTATGLATSDLTATVFNSECLVAPEIGAHLGADITTAYTVNETGKAIVARSGEFLNVMVAASNNITTKGVAMSHNGDGTLKIAVVPAVVGATSEQILFYSDEIINVTGSPALVRMRKA